MFEREGTTASAGVLFWGGLFALAAALMLGWYVPAFEAEHKLPIVDVEAAFDPARTLALIEGYGEAGRHAYLVFLSIDCLYPVTASLFVIALFRALLTALGASEGRKKRITAIPALSAVCDLVENTFHALITMLYPKHGAVLAKLAWVATGAKYMALLTTGALLVVLLAWWAQRRIALRSSRS